MDVDEQIASLRNAVEAELGVLRSAGGTVVELEERVADERTTAPEPRRRGRPLSRQRLLASSATVALYAGLSLLIVVVAILAVHATRAL